MTKYVLAFRGRAGAVPGAEEEAAWSRWFGELGDAIAEWGHRAGRARVLGAEGSLQGQDTVLTGYIVITADSLDEAIALAQGCPGLKSGGLVDVGETVEPE